MSSIAFTSIPSLQTVRVGGAERHHFGSLINNIGQTILRVGDYIGRQTGKAIRAMFPAPPDHYIHNVDHTQLVYTVKLAWCYSFDDTSSITIEGKPFSYWHASLNTVLRIGSDPLKLIARLHGQCEVHAWVDGPNRAWLADIVEQGLDMGLYRRNMGYQGWSDVVEFLRADDKEPVVTSYSVTGSFPNPMGQMDWEDFDDLSAKEQCRIAMASLRTREEEYEYGYELKPDNWNDYYFHNGENMWTMRRHIERTLKEAVG